MTCFPPQVILHQADSCSSHHPQNKDGCCRQMGLELPVHGLSICKVTRLKSKAVREELGEWHWDSKIQYKAGSEIVVHKAVHVIPSKPRWKLISHSSRACETHKFINSVEKVNLKINKYRKVRGRYFNMNTFYCTIPYWFERLKTFKNSWVIVRTLGILILQQVFRF
jgi:hypothetical protein